MSDETKTEEEVPNAVPQETESPSLFDRIGAFLGFFSVGIDRALDPIESLMSFGTVAVQEADRLARKADELESKARELEAQVEAIGDSPAAPASTEADPRIDAIRAILREKTADNSKVAKIRQLVG